MVKLSRSTFGQKFDHSLPHNPGNADPTFAGDLLHRIPVLFGKAHGNAFYLIAVEGLTGSEGWLSHLQHYAVNFHFPQSKSDHGKVKKPGPETGLRVPFNFP